MYCSLQHYSVLRSISYQNISSLKILNPTSIRLPAVLLRVCYFGLPVPNFRTSTSTETPSLYANFDDEWGCVHTGPTWPVDSFIHLPSSTQKIRLTTVKQLTIRIQNPSIRSHYDPPNIISTAQPHSVTHSYNKNQHFPNCGPRTTGGPRLLPLWSS
jgi:hypothetical protein